MKKLITALLLTLLSVTAYAQPAPSGPGPNYFPNWYKGYVPSPQEWQVMWSNKLGYYSAGLPISLGGTGATNANQAAINLGLATGSLASGQIFIGNASNKTANVTPSGDVSLSNAGVFSVNNGAHITNASIPVSGLVAGATTVNGQLCTLGSTCTIPGGSISLAVGSTAITGGSIGNIFYHAASNLLGELTTSGSGSVAMTTNAVLVTPNIGTPSAGVATFLTGLPISTGLAGAGTGVLTALGTNVGTAGSPVVNGGALGTPSGGTATNITGLPVGGIAALATNTIVGNGTAGSASPTALSIPSCSTSASALIWTSSTGFGCNTISGTGTVNSGLANSLAYYSSSGTAVSGLATANNGILVTSGAGAPSIGTAIPSGITATTQAGSDNSTLVATTAQVQAAIAASSSVPSGTIVPFAGVTAPASWQFANGTSVLRASFPSLFTAVTSTSTITVTIASPAVVSWTSHGLQVGSQVYFSNSGGALPTGITANTPYYIITAGFGTNAFEISTSVGGAAVNTTGSQSGTQTALYAPWGIVDATHFNVPDMRGRSVAGSDTMGTTAASRLGAGLTGGITGPAVVGAFGGEQSHTLTSAEQASMSVSGSMSGGGPIFSNPGAGSVQGNVSVDYSIGSTGISGTASGGGGAHNNVAPTLVMNYLVKN